MRETIKLRLVIVSLEALIVVVVGSLFGWPGQAEPSLHVG